ncbi:hypothetical protein FOYG_09306 [Fusarium oxysporum NRRL 32931]|uniref:Uncharacterized protein n=3 Tax=Fusarium oxysporum species complex TaxID=171631 RepID=W9HZD0_FUSOX|nr:hypothetical protein FOYG_09306 [Fusarium oxysporum NRRL 32931]
MPSSHNNSSFSRLNSKPKSPTDSYKMQLINLYALTVFATSALAADCFGNGNKDVGKFITAYWDARERMCSNSGCTYQEACTTSGSYTVKGLGVDTILNVEIKRKNTGGKKGFKDCWDATEDIINQCPKGGSKQLSGSWEANGQLYQINGYFSFN